MRREQSGPPRASGRSVDRGGQHLLWALLGLACGSAHEHAPPPEAPSAAPVDAGSPATEERTPAFTLVAGGVVACAWATPDGPACWGSWSDAVPPGVDFDPHALRPVADDVLELAPGWSHTCERTSVGVRCGGHFDVGDTPAEPPELGDATHLVSGRDFTCGLRPGGRLSCMTSRPHAGLGADGLGPLRSLAANSTDWRLCALGEGAAHCWASLDRPPASVVLPDDAVDLALGLERACVRTTDEQVLCWPVGGASPEVHPIEGLRAEALVALPDRICARAGDRWSCLAGAAGGPQEEPSLDGARAIAGGMGFVCGAFEEGVRCHGDDEYGQLGPFGTPVEEGPPPSGPRVEASGATALAMGRAHACIVTTDRRVACWGANGGGELGDGTRGERTTPRPVPGLSRVVELHAADQHTCARTERGDVRCWGTMLLDHGEDVDPVWRAYRASHRLAAGASAIGSGSDAACVVRAEPPALRCWGSTYVTPRDEWIPLREPARSILVAPDTCVLGASGAAWCFDEERGEMVASDAWRDAVVVVGADSFTCGVVAGQVRCMGRSDRGELGDGSRTSRAEPVPVRGVEGAIGVALGDAHACAVLAGGEVRCWGANLAGQLGDGTRVDRWRAVPVQGVTGAVEIAAAGATSCARLADGTVTCWGAPLGVDEESAASEATASTP